MRSRSSWRGWRRGAVRVAGRAVWRSRKLLWCPAAVSAAVGAGSEAEGGGEGREGASGCGAKVKPAKVDSPWAPGYSAAAQRCLSSFQRRAWPDPKSKRAAANFRDLLLRRARGSRAVPARSRTGDDEHMQKHSPSSSTVLSSTARLVAESTVSHVGSLIRPAAAGRAAAARGHRAAAFEICRASSQVSRRAHPAAREVREDGPAGDAQQPRRPPGRPLRPTRSGAGSSEQKGGARAGSGTGSTREDETLRARSGAQASGAGGVGVAPARGVPAATPEEVLQLWLSSEEKTVRELWREEPPHQLRERSTVTKAVPPPAEVPSLRAAHSKRVRL